MSTVEGLPELIAGQPGEAAGRDLPMPDECPICQGTGFEVATDDGGVTSAVRCACRRERATESRVRAARIPRRYEHCTFDSFEIHHSSHEGSLRLARQWAELYPVVEHGLLFLGEPGRGKTHLAVAIARELLLSKGAAVLFIEQRALLKALQGTFESGSEQRESEILRPAIEAELLILDDLGAGRTTPWAKDVMHDVIAQRYNDQRPMVITSNLPFDEAKETGRGRGRAVDAPLTLRDRLGDALISRLHEMCRIVRVDGKDYRSGVLAQKTNF